MAMPKKDKRFSVSYTQDTFTETLQILVDRTTGVNYLYCASSGYGGGLTPLLNCDGSPVISPTTAHTPEHD